MIKVVDFYRFFLLGRPNSAKEFETIIFSGHYVQTLFFENTIKMKFISFPNCESLLLWIYFAASSV
jgi:hypothetical protein